MIGKELEQLIKKALKDTRENCEFKKAWIPAGWACVNIDVFAWGLVRKIEKELGHKFKN